MSNKAEAGVEFVVFKAIESPGKDWVVAYIAAFGQILQYEELLKVNAGHKVPALNVVYSCKLGYEERIIIPKLSLTANLISQWFVGDFPIIDPQSTLLGSTLHKNIDGFVRGGFIQSLFENVGCSIDTICSELEVWCKHYDALPIEIKQQIKNRFL